MCSTVTVRLSPTQDELWKLFDSETNEMVVTKVGRRFFPKLEYVVDGLDPAKLYTFMIQMELVGHSQHMFVNEKWVESWKPADFQQRTSKMVWHTDGVRTGREWMGTTINFVRLKVTQDWKTNNAQMIPLHSMNKYIPVISVFEAPSNNPFISSSSCQLILETRIPYTEFVAVTSYQNQIMADMKTEHNPFAKRFRKNNNENRKRRASSIVDYSTDESTSKYSSPNLDAPTLPEFNPMNFQSSPTNQFQINPLLFLFTSPLASMPNGTMPFPFFPFGFPPFTPLSVQIPSEENLVKEELSESEKENAIIPEKKFKDSQEPAESTIDIVN